MNQCYIYFANVQLQAIYLINSSCGCLIFFFDKIDIDPQTIIFGAWNLNMPDFILINHMILLLKRYIYLRRQNRHGLKSFIKNIQTVECRTAFDKDKLSFHYKKWEKLLPFL